MPRPKYAPVVALGAFGVGYVLFRPTLAGIIPHLGIVEFPLGAGIVASLLWSALRRSRDELPAPAVWRRHEQVVRILPDPAMRANLDVLERWVETGENPAAAAVVLAKATTKDAQDEERARDALIPRLSQETSRKRRESFLRDHLEPGA